MPTIELTTPDGQKVSLTAPEGASEAEIQSVVDSVIQQMGGSTEPAPTAPNRFASPDGKPWTPETLPEGERLEPMTLMERMGRRFTENTEALANVPAALKNLVTGEGGRGQAALEVAGGALSPFSQITAPGGAMIEQLAAQLGAGDEWAKMIGNVGEMAIPIPVAMAAQAGKLSGPAEAIAAALGVTPGALKATPGVQDFIADAGTSMRGEAAEMAAKAYADRVLPPVVREVVQDLAAMQRSSSLLDAAQQSILPNPGNITLNAAMETAQGQIGRLLPKQTDFFRTTQESIERATGGMGQASAEALRAERDEMARKIEQALLARKNLGEMQQVEAMVDSVAPRAVPKQPSALLDNSPVKGADSKAMARYLLTDDQKALNQVAKSPVAQDAAIGVLGLEGKASNPGTVRMFLEGIFKESTRQVAGFGPAGKVLAKEMVGALDKGEREAGAAVTSIQKLLKGMTPMEKDSLVDFLDQGAMAINPKVAQVGTQIRALLDDVAKRATQAGMTIKNPATGTVIPWAPRPDGNYFPHFSNIDLEELFGNPRRMAEAVKELASENGIDVGEARKMLDYMMKNAQRRYGNLEMSRVMNWRKWDRDPERVLTRYFNGAYKRLNLAEQFNADYNRADQLIEMIGSQSNDSARDMARAYADRILGREPVMDGWKAQLSHDVRNFETATKLGQAVVANSSQPVLLAVVAGMKNTVKALGDVMFRNGEEFAGMTGAVLDSTMAQIQRELGAGSAGQSVLRRTGFSAVEKFNRVLSANAGKHFAQDQFKRLMSALDNGSTSRADFYRDELRKLGIDPADAIGRGGLSLDDLYKAGQAMTKRTQFKTGTADLPIAATTDLGKVLYQFKSFSFKSAQLFKDEIVKEAARGNVAPLVRAAMLMPLAGEIVNDVQALINGKTRPEGLVERIADNFAAVGAFGLLYTAFKAVGFGPAAVAGLLAGPAVTDAIRLITNLGSTGKALYDQSTNPNSQRDPVKPLGKQVVSAIPTVGPTIANRLWPSAEELRRQRGQQ